MFQSFRRPLVGVASLCGAAVFGFVVGKETKNAASSWTTNFTPSVKWDENWDRRQPASLVKPSKMIDPLVQSSENKTDEEKEEEDKKKSTATRFIILVRHGQYNLEGATDNDRFLTSLGEEQAGFAGRRIKELEYPIDRLVYSTMTRATQTANIMMKNMDPIPKVESCDFIREGAPIPPEPPTGQWRPEPHQFFIDGSRIEAAFRKHIHRAPPSQKENSHEVIVCHANVIRYFVCRALQFPPEAWLRIALHNGSLTMLAIRPNGRVSIKALGDFGYMPKKFVSTT